MKSLLVYLLFFSISNISLSMARDKKLSPPRIDVTILPIGVEVSVSNFSADNYECNGSLFIQYKSGENDTEFYYDRIQSGEISDKIFYSKNPSDEVKNVYESIFCYRLSM